MPSFYDSKYKSAQQDYNSALEQYNAAMTTLKQFNPNTSKSNSLTTAGEAILGASSMGIMGGPVGWVIGGLGAILGSILTGIGTSTAQTDAETENKLQTSVNDALTKLGLKQSDYESEKSRIQDEINAYTSNYSPLESALTGQYTQDLFTDSGKGDK